MERYAKLLFVLVGVVAVVGMLITMQNPTGLAVGETNPVCDKIGNLHSECSGKVSIFCHDVSVKANKFCVGKQTFIPACLDTDEGPHTYRYGAAVDANSIKKDKCVDKTHLSEAVCQRGVASTEITACPKGCEDGVCVKVSN